MYKGSVAASIMQLRGLGERGWASVGVHSGGHWESHSRLRGAAAPRAGGAHLLAVGDGEVGVHDGVVEPLVLLDARRQAGPGAASARERNAKLGEAVQRGVVRVELPQERPGLALVVGLQADFGALQVAVEIVRNVQTPFARGGFSAAGGASKRRNGLGHDARSPVERYQMLLTPLCTVLIQLKWPET